MLLLSGKIPVRVNPLFWLLIFLIGWINTATVPLTLVRMGVIFISVLVHEFGHALTAVAFGHRAHIELFALGGMTHRQGPPLELWQDFLIVLNGPLAGFALFLVALLLRITFGNDRMTIPLYALNIAIYVNLFWTIVNLLPIHPLDGGHLLRIILEGMFGLRGIKSAFFISLLLSAGFSLLFFVYGLFLMGALFFLLTFESYRNWTSTLSLTEKDQNLSLQNRLKHAEQELQRGNLEYALQECRKIREETKDGILFMAATEDMAQILAEFGRHKEAYDILYPQLKKLSPEGLQLLHRITYVLGKWEEAISLGNRSFQSNPHYETAVLNALCHSILGQTQPAIGWLQTAINEGLPNLAEVLKKREFDHIRDHPQFQNLLDQAQD